MNEDGSQTESTESDDSGSNEVEGDGPERDEMQERDAGQRESPPRSSDSSESTPVETPTVDSAVDDPDTLDGGESVEDPEDEQSMPGVPNPDEADESDVPTDVQKYARFQKMDGAQYDRVNEFLRDRTYITAREWAIARLCSDFRTETGVEMTKIGENLPELVPFMTDTYTPQAVNQARSSFEDKIRTAGATFLYGAMCDFFTAEELDDVMYESTEVAKFLLEVEGVDLSVEEELEAEERISSVMRDVRDASQELREDEA
ncbi:DUF5806 family protein [Halostagnicola bangensis]